MGSNQSKPIKDQDRDDKENQFHDPAIIDHLRTKKMKTTFFTINEKSTADEDMQNSTHSARRKQKPANNTKGSEVVKRKEHGRENGTNHRAENDFARSHFITDTNMLNMNVDMPDGFKSKLEAISEEKNVMDACGSEKDDEELEANIANDAESNAFRSAHDSKYSIESAVHPSQESAPYKYEAPSTKNQKDDVDNTPKYEMDTVSRTHHFKSIDITSAEENCKYPANQSEIGASGCSITFDGKSSLLRTTVCEESQSQSKSKLQNNTSSELPEPNIMQDTSREAANTVYASVSCMVTSLSSLASSNTVLSSSYTPLFSNVDTVSSHSSLSSPSILTQSSAFGNFSDSGNRLSSDTTSSLSHSTNNSTDGFRYGNFSMNSSAPAADGSSYVSNGSLRSSIIPSNSQFDFTQRFRHSPNVYDSQTGVPAGSSTNSVSGVIRNSIARNSNYESPNSHTSLSFDTSTVSNLTSVYLANSSNYVLRNRNGLENDVETDGLDLFDDEVIAQQLYWSSYNNSRDTHVVDGDFITIRTSVGDTTTRISSKNITLNENFVGNDLTDENMGIILERPKYPRYSTLASREKSFENVWPATNKMSWEKLPEAGFVYTGTADCVRCYYCNGGLREWLKNDCPWTEHARYYPHCPHVRQCKGDEFVRRVREGTDGGTSAQDGGSGDKMEVDNETAGTSLRRDQEAMEIAAEIISDQTLLEKAAYYIKNVQGKSSFDAQELAAIAFEIEDGTITFNFEDALEDDTTCIVDEVLAESSDSEEEIEIDGPMLEKENRMLRERSLCKVCLDATACVLFLDCGHMIACPMCAPALKTCAVCRAEVKGTVRAIYATDS